MTTYDVFLSHNSADKAAVVAIAQLLRSAGVRPWLDEWNLVPGATWQQGLLEGIAASACTALFVGEAGVGSWQNAESMLILDRAFADPSYRLIPVILPGAPGGIRSLFPSFVSLFTWVDFRNGIHDADAFQRLVAGIRGESPGPAPHRPESQQHMRAPTDLDRCLEALGVPHEDVPAAAEWLARRVTEKQLRDELPSARWPVAVRHAVMAFQRDLTFYAWPELLLENSFYISTSKIARMYRAHRPEVGDHEEVADRFRVLHRYLSERGRLAFTPSSLLLKEPFPSSDDIWLYFSGSFTMAVDDNVFAAVPEARTIIESANRRELYNLVGQVFGPQDPFFLPMLEFRGSIGPRDVTVLMSRKYVGFESATATVLGTALFGDSVSFSGFGTLIQNELQPVICRFTQGE